ncbi:MAG: Flp family type IVb pilin [Chloroflexota bacterium]|nr:Flp family type IVb pilin [Chloroflexota bacterium]
MFKKFLSDNDGLSLVEYIVGGALGALLLFTIARTIFDNVKARAEGANVSLTSHIPSS